VAVNFPTSQKCLGGSLKGENMSGNNLLKVVLVLIAAISISFLAWMRTQPAWAGQPASLPQPTGATASDPQQYPMVDAIANKIIQKYQNSTCDQLWQEKAEAKNKPKSPEEQRAIGILHNDAQLRHAFIGQIAAPVADKMFQCGMIP
jgi:hypothetical protein